MPRKPYRSIPVRESVIALTHLSSLCFTASQPHTHAKWSHLSPAGALHGIVNCVVMSGAAATCVNAKNAVKLYIYAWLACASAFQTVSPCMLTLSVRQDPDCATDCLIGALVLLCGAQYSTGATHDERQTRRNRLAWFSKKPSPQTISLLDIFGVVSRLTFLRHVQLFFFPRKWHCELPWSWERRSFLEVLQPKANYLSLLIKTIKMNYLLFGHWPASQWKLLFPGNGRKLHKLMRTIRYLQRWMTWGHFNHPMLAGSSISHRIKKAGHFGWIFVQWELMTTCPLLSFISIIQTNH